MLGISVILSYAVFVYLRICICVFVYLTVQNIIFDILEPPAVQKYSICWVFRSFCHMLYLCICVFVNLYLCICAFVFVYLTVQNIMFDVLGPLALQKYIIIRVYKVFQARRLTQN